MIYSAFEMDRERGMERIEKYVSGVRLAFGLDFLSVFKCQLSEFEFGDVYRLSERADRLRQ